MVGSSFVYTIASGLIQLNESAIYNAMCSSFGACLQLMFVLLPINIPGHQSFDLPSFLLAVSLTIVAAVYVATDDKRDMELLMNSFIGRFFNKAITHEKQPLLFPISGLLIYVGTWIAITVMWVTGVKNS